MESELQDIHPKPPKQPDPTRDDRPLLKSVVITTATTTVTNSDDLEKKFAPYVRCDVYGNMGRGELPTKEKVFLGVALVTLVPVRVVAAMTILLLYYLICRVCTLFSVPHGEDEQEDYAHVVGWRRIVIVKCGKALSRVMLFILGFYWITQSYKEIPSTTEENKTQPEEMRRPGVIISNHVSYLDILYHTSSSFPSFVAKRSVAKLPLVGLISKCLGCIYVQREAKASDVKGVSAVVTERIREAHRNASAPIVMLFPEGTTTNGEFLLPFKTGGFLANAPVLPVILSYHYQRFSPAWDSISGEKDDPKLYASNVRRLMASEGNLTLSDIGLAEKRIYHAALNGLFSQC